MIELTTVADDEAVVHDGPRVIRHDGLEPDTDHELDGVAFRTLAAPGRAARHGRHRQRRPLRRDECGVIEGLDDRARSCGPSRASRPTPR